MTFKNVIIHFQLSGCHANVSFQNNTFVTHLGNVCWTLSYLWVHSENMEEKGKKYDPWIYAEESYKMHMYIH